jgi:hypothetical protein
VLPDARRRTPVSRVLIDGRNVQRALERGSSGQLPTFALIARLRGVFAGIDVELILDGHASGSPTGRVAPGFSVAFSRSRSADAVIADRVVELARDLGPGRSDSVLVVSDDREVRDQARYHGAQVERTSWLIARLGNRGSVDAGGPPGRPGARPKPGTSLGHGRPPRAPGRAPAESPRRSRRGGGGC